MENCSRFAWGFLAVWADVRAATADPDFLYNCAAARARLAFFSKHLGKAHVAALFALGINVIAVGTAALFYGQAQHG